ncbi:MAG TPA: ABC transporter ATP-binding protein [Candidatus Eisenbacteria bacterium]|nr:ABC transporter ATP-binding protein [Candidatus Eisenbacteria bacterium]
MGRSRAPRRSASLRLLQYLRPYRGHLVLTAALMVGFAITSGISIGMISPFVKILFTPQHQAGAEAVPGGAEGASTASPQGPRATAPGTPTIPGMDPVTSSVLSGSAPEAPHGASAAKKSPGGIVARVTEWKDDLRTWFEHFFMTGDPSRSLNRICITLLIVFLFKNIFDYLQSVLTVWVEQAVVRDMRNEVYGHLHELSLSFFHSRRSGALLSRLTNDIALVRGALAAGFSNLIKSGLLLVVCLFWIFWTSWRLALVSLFVVPPSVLLIVWLGKKLRRRSTITQERMADLNSILQETLTGIRVVKAFSMEEFEKRKFARAAQDYFRSFVKQRRLGAVAGPLSETLGVVAAVAVLWYGGHEILLQRALEPQQFFIFLFAMLQLMSPLKSLSNVNATIQEGLAAAVRIFRVLDTKPTVASKPNARIADGIHEGIEFQNVSFRYASGGEVLHDVSLRVAAGEVVALVGPSGAGKSTLVDLVARFYDPTEGRILLDGRDLRDYDVASLRRMMGVVTQESILFHDTVWNNIAYGVTDAEESAVRLAARAANAERFIQDLPEGFQTPIGDRGVLLSGGERQRIAIARAIFKSPPLLLLDEATSSLDSESELLVQEALETLFAGRTVFVIAHRLSTIQRADRILVLDHGRIVQTGTHRELVATPGLYQKLHRLQFRLADIAAQNRAG